MDELLRVEAALKTVLPDATGDERDLHQLVARALAGAGIAFTHEARVAPGARIDFLAGGVGIEVKRSASRALLMKQARKYLAAEPVRSLVVATRRGVDFPTSILGKPVKTVCLGRNWGIAIH